MILPTKTETKKSNFSLFSQAIAKNKNNDDNVVNFHRLFLLACGCTRCTETSESFMDIVSKSLYTRGLTKSLKTEFTEGFKFDGCYNFLKNNLTETESLFYDFGIPPKQIKDFDLLCRAIAQKAELYYEHKDNAVFKNVRDLYNDLIADALTKDDIEKRELVYNKLSDDAKINIKNYLDKVKSINSSIKTIVNPSEKIKFYDLYVCNHLKYTTTTKTETGTITRNVQIENVSIKTLFAQCPNNLLIEARGGVGKTMMLKHLTLDAIANFKTSHMLPVLINLSDYNNEEDIELFTLDKINTLLENPISIDTYRYFLTNGMCIFLLDALDEIKQEYVYGFDKALNIFATRYNKNRFIISSRPTDNSLYLNTFFNLRLDDFDKIQALTLIRKIEFRPDEPEIKETFLNQLNKRLFKTYPFCSNPLLLSIMLLTYEKSGIPTQQHLFYKKAYYALSEKYSSGRGQYAKGLSTKLTPERLFEYVIQFCFVTYYQNAYSFTEEEFEAFFNQLKEKDRHEYETFTYREFLQDLEKHICLLYKDGLRYRFIHRSFQEYFCATYFIKQKADRYPAISKFLDTRKVKTTAPFDGKTFVFFFDDENVLPFMHDMRPTFVEEYIFKPKLEEVINLSMSVDDDAFFYFLSKAFTSISYTHGCCAYGTDCLPDSKIIRYISVLNDLYITEKNLHNLTEYLEYAEERFFIPEVDDDEYQQLSPEPASMDPEYDSLDFCGYQISIPIKDILEKPKYFEDLISELKESYIYDLYVLCKEQLILLKDKYQPKISDDLIELLD